MDMFIQNDECNSSEKIISKIKNGEWEYILKCLCVNNGTTIFIDYTYFKHFATKETYNIILNHIINNIDSVLTNHDLFYVHLNMKNLTISDIDKHKMFIQHISFVLKNKYPNKLTKCYIHNASFIFSQIFNIICMFVDKETQEKIEVIKN